MESPEKTLPPTNDEDILPEKDGSNQASDTSVSDLLKAAEESEATAKDSSNHTATTSMSTEQKISTRRPGRAPDIPIFERRNWLIHLHYIRKDYTNCKSLLQEVLLESKEMCEYALYVKALILREEGNIQQSLDVFQQCVQIDQSNANNLKQVARSLFLLGRHKAALQVYKEASKISIDDWEIYHNQGICLMYLRNYQKARELLRLALNTSRHDISYMMLAKCHLLESDLTGAGDVLKRAVEYSPENPELMTALGVLYLQTGHSQKAFIQFGNALTYNVYNTQGILAAGAMIQEKGDFDVALSKYRIAVQTIPESPQLWNNVGMCFYGKVKFVAAVSCLKHAAFLAPFEWTIMHNLGLVFLSMKQYASAFHYLSAAITLKPKVAQLFMLLAVALTHLSSFDDARKAYDQAVLLDGNLNAHLNYAVFLYKQNDQRAASKQLGIFLKKMETMKAEAFPEAKEIAEKLEAVLQVGNVHS